MVDERNRVMYCYVPKVACTQWKTVFAFLNGYLKEIKAFDSGDYKVHHAPKGTYKFLNEYSVPNRTKMLRDYYKFAFAREPFARLLSAYKDKFSSFARDTTFKDAWSPSVRTFIRKQKPQRNDSDISFEEFLRYVSQLGNGFWQEHWKRFYDLCHPCVIDYNFIGHFENIKDEGPYVVQKAWKASLFNGTLMFPPYSPSNTSSDFLKFYSQIPKDLIVTIANIYRLDFELLGYPFPGVLGEILADFIDPTNRTAAVNKR